MPATVFTPLTLGRVLLENRIVMAPMTRCRAVGNVPNELMATYYRQRAGAGLIITEGTSPSPNGLGYARMPGVFTDAQVQGWRRVTTGVHEAGGKIFVQLMHTGRVAHPENMSAGTRILAPSAIAAPGQMWTDRDGQQPHPIPTAMADDDIAHVIVEFATAATRAIEAGFDGIELHAANGYLLEQFLNTASNQRTDRWGSGPDGASAASGPEGASAALVSGGGEPEGHGERGIENRGRLAVEVAKACASAIGAERIGMRISPYGVAGGMTADADTDSVYEHLVARLNTIGMAYIHVVDHSSMGAPAVSPALKAKIRATFKGRYILSGGYDLARANADLDAQRGDLVAFGRPFISNPDLVRKLQSALALTPPDATTFYTPDEKGYTDY
jgi:N-ethylmaleimide reductase